MYCEDDLSGGLTKWDSSSITYATGHTGKACRSSHNNDDGYWSPIYGFQVEHRMPSSGELYISFWINYEAGFYGYCETPKIWNVKWLWTGTPTAETHAECIFQSYTDGSIGLAWQLSGTVAHYASGAIKYGSFSYTMGDWMHVEFYIKQSTGANKNNHDGVMRVTVNSVNVINETDVATGDWSEFPIRVPGIKGSCACPSGSGWWMIDDYEAFDGIPTADTTAPTVTAFTIPSTSLSLLVSISSFTCTDAVGVTGYQITETESAPVSTGAGWTATAPTSYTFGSTGEKTLYGWCKDAANNVSTSGTDTVTVSQAISKAPFIIP